MDNYFNLICIAFFVGFIGDLLLQVIDNKNFGLRGYFKQHGSVESLFIAGGMLTLFYIIYLKLNIPLKWEYLVVYGVILDFLFRKFVIFPSLDGYYNALNYFESGLWGAIPILLPYIIYTYFNLNK